MFRTHGITRDSDKLINDDAPWYYEQHHLGFNYRMTDIQAALGISQMEKLNSFLEKRRELAEIYNEELRNIDGIVLPMQLENTNSAWHLYVIKLDINRIKAGRREIFEELRKSNIGVNVHYIPVYYHPYYQNLGYKKGLCPEAEKLYEGIITLPLYPMMTKDDIKYIVNSLKEIVDIYRVD